MSIYNCAGIKYMRIVSAKLLFFCEICKLLALSIVCLDLFLYICRNSYKQKTTNILYFNEKDRIHNRCHKRHR